MSDERYDAVVAGGGHHAMIIAPYLARAGLSVLVLERSAHLGGGASSSEGPAPGFVMNHCSHWTRFYAHPAYRDFGLYDEGLHYVFPEENEGMVFVGFSASRVVDAKTGRQERSDENIHRTWEQIARFSRADADTYLELLEAYERHWKQAFRRHRFSFPPPWGTPDPLEELIDTLGDVAADAGIDLIAIRIGALIETAGRSNRFGQAACLSILLIALSVLALLIYHRLLRRAARWIA